MYEKNDTLISESIVEYEDDSGPLKRLRKQAPALMWGHTLHFRVWILNMRNQVSCDRQYRLV